MSIDGGSDESTNAVTPALTPDGPPAATSAAAQLGFDRAEFDVAPPAVGTCAACGAAINGPCYRSQGKWICARCREVIGAQLNAGAGARPFLRALGTGSVAALVGSIAWYAITKVTGYQLGLVAIAVGFLVGKAVRRSSGGIGGRRYQVLAMVLTYAAIAFTNVPDVIQGLTRRQPHAATAATATAPPSTMDYPAPASAEAPAAPSDIASHDNPAPGHVGLGAVLLAFLFVFGIAFIAPFLGGASGIMGLVITAIALYEAWKINRATTIVFEGPLSIEAFAATQPNAQLAPVEPPPVV